MRSVRSARGSILVLSAVMMAAMMGVVALAIDGSYMYAQRNRLYAAADAGAKIGAIEVHHNGSVSSTDLQTFVYDQVNAHGFTAGICGTSTIGTAQTCIYHPPVSGPFTGNAGYVEVIVSQPYDTFFGGGFLGLSSMTPAARAVAGTANPNNCLIVQQNLTMGNSSVQTNGCGVGVGGQINGTNPNSRIEGSPTPDVSAGSCTGTCGAMGNLTTGSPPPTDPLAGLLLYTSPTGTNCPAGAPGTGTTLTAGCYTSIADTVTTLGAGLYYITGPVDIDNLSGTGVMLYLTGAGQLRATTPQNNREIHISAPTSGPYIGIGIFQAPTDTNNFEAGNNFTLDVTGAIYMPGVDIVFNNSPFIGSSVCTLMVAHSIDIRNGNGMGFTNTGCAATFGGAAFLSVAMAE